MNECNMNEREIQIIRAWVFRIENRRIKISAGVKVEQEGNCDHVHWRILHAREKGRGIE